MRRVTVSMALIVVLAGAVFLAWQKSRKGASSPSAYKIEEEILGVFFRPVLTPVVSKDGCHLACVTSRGAKFVVSMDGQAGPEYDGIAEGDPIFSLDGKRVAYAAQEDKKWRLIIDGEAGPEYDVIVRGGPTLHADGVLEYLAAKNKTLYRVKHVPAAK